MVVFFFDLVFMGQLLCGEASEEPARIAVTKLLCQIIIILASLLFTFTNVYQEF